MLKNVRFRTAVLVLLAASLCMSAGCIGNFKLTNSLYDWNKKLDGKWTEELVFLGFVLLPVYSITLFVDGIILNSVDFWTNDTEMTSNEKIFQDGPYTIRLARTKTPEGRTLNVRVYEGETLLEEQVLVAQPDGAIVKRDADGQLLAWGTVESDGRVIVRDGATGALILDVPCGEVPAVVD